MMLVLVGRGTTTILSHGSSRQRGTSEALEFILEQACSQLVYAAGGTCWSECSPEVRERGSVSLQVDCISLKRERGDARKKTEMKELAEPE